MRDATTGLAAQHGVDASPTHIEGGFAQLAPHLAAHFVKAELKHFGYGELDRAVEWAQAYTETS
jgi:hypothetical protein